MTDAPTMTTTPPAESEGPASPAPATAAAPISTDRRFIWGTGRRKRAIARVRVCPGEGTFVVNGRPMEKYFHLDKDRNAVRTPLQITETLKSFDVFVNVSGGGPSGQSGAVLLGLSRALAEIDPQYNAKLREKQLLKRDPRKVERKKYGQRGARRRFQFSKR